jgi:hypothetical protein
MDLIALSSAEKLLIQRTVSWQRVSVLDNKDYCAAALSCWSPDGMSLALALQEGGYGLYDLELGMTTEEDSIVYQHQQENQVVTALAWAQVGLVHAAWILTDEEQEREMEWGYVAKGFVRRNVWRCQPACANTLNSFLDIDRRTWTDQPLLFHQAPITKGTEKMR